MQLHKDSERTRIVYAESLSIQRISADKKCYQEALQLQNPLFLDAQKVQTVDGASLQLLLSFLLTAKHQQISWKWQSCSPPLSSAVCLLGMEKLLAIPPS